MTKVHGSASFPRNGKFDDDVFQEKTPLVQRHELPQTLFFVAPRCLMRYRSQLQLQLELRLAAIWGPKRKPRVLLSAMQIEPPRWRPLPGEQFKFEGVRSRQF